MFKPAKMQSPMTENQYTRLKQSNIFHNICSLFLFIVQSFLILFIYLKIDSSRKTLIQTS